MRLLIAAEEAVEHPSQIPAGVRVLIKAATEIWVMSPSLVGPIQWLTGGVDEARQSADRRLEVVLGQLAAEGISASGARSGDELGPTAFDDALRQFPADHDIMGLRSSKKGPWQRQRRSIISSIGTTSPSRSSGRAPEPTQAPGCRVHTTQALRWHGHRLP